MSEDKAKRAAAKKKLGKEGPSRADYSAEEIQSLLAGIDTVVSAHKAEKEGINPEDMIKTVRGGKTIWITKDEMNATLAKRRKVTGVKYAQRTNRGDDSVASEVNRRISECRALINYIRVISPEEVNELGRMIRELEAIQNRISSLGQDVSMLEKAIDRKKGDDPVFAEMDEVKSKMMEAMDAGKLEDYELCQSHHDRHMDEYLVKEKRLQPYIEKARKCRTKFLLHRRRLFQVEFKLIAHGEEIMTKKIPVILYHDKQGEASQHLSELANKVQDIVGEGRPSFLALDDCPEDQLEQQKETLAALDKGFLTPLFSQISKYIEAFREAWSEFVEGTGEASSSRASTVAHAHTSSTRAGLENKRSGSRD